MSIANKNRQLAPANPQAAGGEAQLVRAFDAVIKEADAPKLVFITAEATTLSLPKERCVFRWSVYVPYIEMLAYKSVGESMGGCPCDAHVSVTQPAGTKMN